MKKIIALTTCMLAYMAVYAQAITANEMMAKYAVIYASVVSMTTFASAYIPFLQNIGTARRALIIGISIGATVISFGLSTPIEILMGFIGQALVYDKILKPAGVTVPKVNKEIT